MTFGAAIRRLYVGARTLPRADQLWRISLPGGSRRRRALAPLGVLLLACLLDASVPPQGVGVIEGQVSEHPHAPRRTASRYPGAPAESREVQSIPAVAFIQGPVAGAPARPPATPPTMAQHDTAFVPSVLTIPVGTTVRFPNTDPFFHNVFSYSPAARFDLGRYPKGEAKDVTFDKPGIVKVYCEVHDFMRGAIVVTENPFAAVVKDGRFRMEGVPAGTYTLVVWHADLGTVKQQVTVEAGGTAHVHVDLK
jgi:plastocyanin